jgi:lipid-binding SYLF domain-containing protein
MLHLLKLAIASLCVLLLAACQSTGSDGKPLTAQEIEQKRESTLAMSKTALAALIKQNPAVKKEIEDAPGYAIFNTTNVNVVLLVVARGEGVLFDKRRPEPLFMEAMKTGEGVGAGYQQQYQIIVFKNTSAIDQFLLTSIDGQRGGMDVDANFSAGSGGTVRSFNPNITIYTVGLAGYDLQANYGGTLYLVDNQLNDAKTLNSLPKKQK